MIINCPNCNSKHIENNICSDCKYHVFVLHNDTNLNKKESDYNSLANFLFEKTNLKPFIIKNIIKLDLLHLFPNYKFYQDIFDNKIVSLPNFYIYPENYKKTIEFFFASFNFYNKEYKLTTVDNYYSGVYVFSSIIKDKHIFIDRSYDYAKQKYILSIYTQYIENNSIPYDIDLLNKSENDVLYSKLNFQLEDIQSNFFPFCDDLKLSSTVFCSGIHSCFLSTQIDIDFNKDIFLIHKDLDIQIQSFLDNVDKLMNHYKEKNKLIFQRALTEIQINNF